MSPLMDVFEGRPQFLWKFMLKYFWTFAYHLVFHIVMNLCSYVLLKDSLLNSVQLTSLVSSSFTRWSSAFSVFYLPTSQLLLNMLLAPVSVYFHWAYIFFSLLITLHVVLKLLEKIVVFFFFSFRKNCLLLIWNVHSVTSFLNFLLNRIFLSILW